MQQLKSGDFEFISEEFIDSGDVIIAKNGDDETIIKKSSIGEYEIKDYTHSPIIEQLPVPEEITMRQARLVLLGTDMLGAVENSIAAMPEPVKSAAKIEWEYSQVVKRKNGFVEKLAPVIGWSEKQIDDLFIAGSKL